MGWTKRELIEDAFGELALAGYVFDLSPEEMQAALRRLDSMMASWAGQDIQIGYALAASANSSDLDQDSGIPIVANLAVTLKLAINIAGGKGKQLPQSTKVSAKEAYDALLSYVATQQVQQQQFRSGLPAGAGNKPWRYDNAPFLPPPNTAPLGVGEGGDLTFNGN